MIELWEGVYVVHLDGVNVYVLTHDCAVTLIGAGASHTSPQLVEALREGGWAPSDVRRIVVNSWSPDALGGAREFPRADLLVTTPSASSSPRNWERHLAARRADEQALGRDVLAACASLSLDDRWTEDDLEHYLAAKYPRGTTALDFIPVRPGQQLAAGGLTLDVLDADVVAPGNCFLRSAEHNALFVGELRLDGLPVVAGAVQQYFAAIDHASQLQPQWVLPLHEAPTARGAWTLRLASRFASNYLSNAATMLMQPRTLFDIVDADQGPATIGEMVEGVLSHRPFLEELVAIGVVSASGEGLQRTYRAR